MAAAIIPPMALSTEQSALYALCDLIGDDGKPVLAIPLQFVENRWAHSMSEREKIVFRFLLQKFAVTLASAGASADAVRAYFDATSELGVTAQSLGISPPDVDNPPDVYATIAAMRAMTTEMPDSPDEIFAAIGDGTAPKEQDPEQKSKEEQLDAAHYVLHGQEEAYQVIALCTAEEHDGVYSFLQHNGVAIIQGIVASLQNEKGLSDNEMIAWATSEMARVHEIRHRPEEEVLEWFNSQQKD